MTHPCSHAGLTAELDGTEIQGRANLAGYATRIPWHCPDGCARGSQPGHAGHCWRKYITTAVWASPAAHQLRDALAARKKASAALADNVISVSDDEFAALIANAACADDSVCAAAAILLATIDAAAGA